MFFRRYTCNREHESETIVGIVNMTMRAASLLSRFILSIYMAQMISFEELGLFGIIVGIVGIAPSILGFGVGYFVRREVLTLTTFEAFLLVRDRFVWNLVLAAAIWVCAAIILFSCAKPLSSWYLLVATIVTLEFLAFDTHVALINMRRPIAANFLLFVRNAFWIVPVILLGLFDQVYRSIDTILVLWTCMLFLSLALSVKVLPDAPWNSFFHRRVLVARLWGMFKEAPLVYTNDVASNSQIYAERFIIASLMGMTATGIYTLYFAVAHGVYVLVSTAVTQISVTKLSDVLSAGGPKEFDAALRREVFRVAMFSIPLVSTILVLALYALPAVGVDILADEPFVLTLMLFSSILKLVSDLCGMELYLRRADRVLAKINLWLFFMSVCLTISFVQLWGLAGAGVSAILCQATAIIVQSLSAKTYA